jgi:hypothetical protein
MNLAKTLLLTAVETEAQWSLQVWLRILNFLDTGDDADGCDSSAEGFDILNHDAIDAGLNFRADDTLDSAQTSTQVLLLLLLLSA